MKTIISTILLSLGFLNLNAQIYAQPGASGTGMSPDSPIDLQSALDMASQGVSSAIWLTEGVYTNTPYVLDMTASDLEYVTITGSFNPDYTDLSYDPLSTAIDAGFGARALDIIATNTLSTQLGIEINDLTIRNGITNDENGAGIRADGGDPDTDGTLLSLNVTNVHFYDNVCSGSGSGGALWTNANPSFWDCAFDGNEGSNGGALFIANQGDGTQNGGGIYSCTFSNNLNFGNQGSTLWTNRYDFDITNSNFYGMDGGASSGNGSCIWGNTGSYLKIYTCRFEGIRINYWGSAVQNWDSDIDIVNCLFKDNKSGINNGYGSYAYYHNNGPDRDINIAQCTFVGNEGQNNVAWGAVQYRGNGADQLTVVNSLFWDNGNTPVVAEFGSASMSNCVTEFNPSGFSSTLDLVTTDPGLVNGYQFDETSVCVDAADELLNYIEDFSGLGRDVDGSPRNLSFQEPLTLDIGAYEFNAPPTGIGLVVFFPLEEGHSVP
ncbi:MAG: hypothetical protein HKN45_09890, partial [Flavobacteriales bacterium]|nr:hypothetical protein [Flavobacteriales bacterium]